MPLTESERTALIEIEQHFHRPPSAPARSRSHRSPSRRVAIAAIVLPAGVAATLLGLLIDNAAGVALAALAYLAIVGSFAVLAGSIARAHAARAGLDQVRPLQWNRKYLR